MSSQMDCSLVNNLAIYKEQCQFVIDNKCLEDSSFIDYVDLLYCKLDYNIFGSIILFTLLFLLFISLSTANQFLCPNLLSVAKVIGMSDSLAGVTLLAFGNGCPEIFASLAAAAADRPDMIVGELIGGGIFCTSIVSGVIFIRYEFKLACRPMLRDSIFYLIASYCVWLTCYYGKVRFIHSMGFILLYIIYLTVAYVGQAIYKRRKENATKQLDIKRATTNINGLVSELSDPSNDNIFNSSKGVLPRRISTISDSLKKVVPAENQSIHLKSYSQNSRPESMIFNGQTDAASATYKEDWLDQRESDCKTNCENIGEFGDLLVNLCPVNLNKWSNNGILKRIYKLIKAPINFVMIITIPVVDYDQTRDRWCRLLNAAHCILVPLTTTLLTSTSHLPTIFGIPLYIMTIIIGFLLSILVICTSTYDTPPKYHSLFAYVGFVMSIIWVYYIAAEIVGLLKTVGLMFSMSDTVIGLGILAWGNSLGDLFANLTLAKSGHSRLALGACIGAPLLNLLLGFGLSFGIYLGPGGQIDVIYTPTLALLYFTLTTILLVLMISTILPPKWSRKTYGYFLIVLYIVYISLEGAIEYNYINIGF